MFNQKKYNKEYREINKEKLRARKKAFRLANLEKIKESLEAIKDKVRKNGNHQ